MTDIKRSRQILKMILLIVSVFLTGKVYAQDIQSLDNKLQEIQTEFQIPGVSLTAVKNSNIIYNFHSGILKKGENQNISENTLFSIASVTKTFTALAIAKLAEEQKIDIDDPIKKYLPWFKLDDKYVTEKITIRDALSHRSGLASEGLIYLGGALSRNETVEKLQYMLLNDRFRSSFSYSNILYNALGLIIKEVTGVSWEEYVQINILEQLEMGESVSSPHLISSNQIATPHRYIDYEQGAILPVGDEPKNQANRSDFPTSNAPAGGIVSNSFDMGKYLTELLNDSLTIISKNSLKSLWEPHTRIQSSFYSKMTSQGSFVSYGLGWFLGDYDGNRVMFHPGGGGGSTSLIMIIPSKKIGVFVSTNLDSWSVFAFANTVIDELLESNLKKDWLRELKPYEENPEQLSDWYNEFLKTRIIGTSPTLSLEKYVGVYTHKIYGSVYIQMENDKLIAKRGTFNSDLSHWHYDTFRSIDRSKKIGFDTITFFVDQSGSIGELMIWDTKGFVKEGNTSHEHH